MLEGKKHIAGKKEPTVVVINQFPTFADHFSSMISCHPEKMFLIQTARKQKMCMTNIFPLT